MCSSRQWLQATAVALWLATCGCTFQQEAKKPDPPPATPDIASEAIECARKIVSDPSNWKNNTGLLTDLNGFAQDLNISDTSEFKEFDAAAQNLIQFGTIWISRTDESDISQLRSQLSKLTSNTEGSIQIDSNADGPVPGEIQGKFDTNTNSQQVQKDAERSIFQSVQGLRAAQADEFGKLYARAQAAYRGLRGILLSKRKITGGNESLP